MNLLTVDEVDLDYGKYPQPAEILITMDLQKKQLANANVHNSTFF